MALFSVELLLEVEANTAEDAASLALLEARTTNDPLTLFVYSDVGEAVEDKQAEAVEDAAGGPGSARHWRRVRVKASDYA